MNKEQITSVAFGGPNVGSGNLVEMMILEKEARQNWKTWIYFVDDLANMIARGGHSHVSSDVGRGIEYSENSSKTRDSLAGTWLQYQFARSTVKWLASLPEECSLFISAQNMLIEGLRKGQVNTRLVLEYPDTRSKLPKKLDKKTIERLDGVTHLTWVTETFHELCQFTDKVELIRPPDPRTIVTAKEEETLALKCFIKVSGSGGDSRFINQISRTLANQKIGCVVATDAKHAARVFESSVISDNDYYARTGVMKTGLMAINPSEQIKYLAILSQEENDIFVISLPPRGEHEVANLVWAIHHGLIKSICVPKEYQEKLHGLLIKAGLDREVAYVDPSELTLTSFFKPEKWKMDERAVSVTHAIKKSI